MRCFRTPPVRSGGALVRAPRIAILGLSLLAVQPLPAGAQAAAPARTTGSVEPHQVSLARSLFEQGLRFVDAGEWSQAADRFSRVLAVRYSAVADYNLALARARLGQSVRALDRLRELLAHPDLEPTVRDAAVALHREVEATVGWLTVRVAGDCSECRVMLDASPLSAAALSAALPVDPGQHALSLVSGELELDSANLTIARGARVEASLHAAHSQAAAASNSTSVPGAPAPAAALAARHDTPAESSGSLLTSPWFWGGVGVLAAGVVTLGVVLGSGGTQAASPVPGDFTPGVISGEVQR